MKFSLFSKILIGFMVAFSLIIGLGILNFISTLRLTDSSLKLQASKNRVIVLEQTSSLLKDIQRAHRGFVVTKDKRFLDPYYNSLELVPQIKSELRVTRWPESERTPVGQIALLIDQKVKLAHDALLSPYLTNSDSIVKKIFEGKQLVDSINFLITSVKKQELTSQDQLSEEEKERITWNKTIIISSIIAFSILLVIGLIELARSLNDRHRLFMELQKKNKEIFDKNEELNSLVEEVNRSNTSLTDANRKLEQANDDLESFSYSVSHDLKSPLRKVIIQTQNIVDAGGSSSDTERSLNTILKTSKQMSALVDKLLSFSQVGITALNKVEVNMDELVNDVVNDMRSSHTNMTISILTKLGNVNGDVSLLRQVWANLLSNAMKFSSQVAQPEIKINAVEAGDSVYYSVADNGVGFDGSRAKDLFEVFKRFHSAEYSGSGIGLAIVKRIVQSHGGEIHASGELGRGATFTFSLPR